ncbi:nuclear transport factor 2 family protein [Pseudonocardia phyllosphaerae]|uniref:nuclear transport factor 2 family protein n=1 Tax=Pseudonocardia phyllosphaerae TaxID=3390502 RepID=UPI00397D5899
MSLRKSTLIALPLAAATAALLATAGCGSDAAGAPQDAARSAAAAAPAAAPSSDAKKVVTEFYEQGFVKKDFKNAVDKYVADDYIQHNPQVTDGKKAFLDGLGETIASPDLKIRIGRVISEGDLVVVHAEWTQKADSTAVADIFRVANGKIVEHWDVQQEIPKKTASGRPMV